MSQAIAAIVAKMRADLEEVGGFENELIGVPAYGVRAYIERLEAALKAEAVEASQKIATECEAEATRGIAPYCLSGKP